MANNILHSPSGNAWIVQVDDDGRLATVATAATPEAPLTDAVTVADILSAVSQDVRHQLDASGDATLLIDYTDRAHKQMLRASRWRFLLSPVKSFQTVEGKTDYWIGVSAECPVDQQDTGLNISDILTVQRGSVIDRTNNRPLFVSDEKPLGDMWDREDKALVYRYDSSKPYTISIYPLPEGKVATIDFRYHKSQLDLTAATDAVQIPTRYKDILIEGVNARALRYLKQYEDAGIAQSAFMQGLREIIRDYNLHPQGPNFVRPDRASVAPQALIATFDDLYVRS